MKETTTTANNKNEIIDKILIDNGYKDYKWIKGDEIIVSQWVRMKCIFGCSQYGKNVTCPPNSPSVPECERFFKEYKSAVLMRFHLKNLSKEKMEEWTKKKNTALQVPKLW